jgi:hypothetical protein
MRFLIVLGISWALTGAPSETTPVASTNVAPPVALTVNNTSCGYCDLWFLGQLPIWNCDLAPYSDCDPHNLFGESFCVQKPSGCAYTRLDITGSGKVLAEAAYCSSVGETSRAVEFAEGSYRYIDQRPSSTGDGR